MAVSQRPLSAAALTEPASVAGWRDLPTWYMISERDNAIPPDAERFMCPCHGGVYYKDGTVAAGPPPKPLVRYDVRIENGEVQVQVLPIPITTV